MTHQGSCLFFSRFRLIYTGFTITRKEFIELECRRVCCKSSINFYVKDSVVIPILLSLTHCNSIILYIYFTIKYQYFQSNSKASLFPLHFFQCFSISVPIKPFNFNGVYIFTKYNVIVHRIGYLQDHNVDIISSYISLVSFRNTNRYNANTIRSKLLMFSSGSRSYFFVEISFCLLTSFVLMLQIYLPHSLYFVYLVECDSEGMSGGRNV